MSSTSAVGDGLPAAPAPRSSVLAVLQRIGRSLMLPIATLPVAALLLRFGQPDMLGPQGLAQYGGFHWVTHVGVVFGAAGNALFTNLPLLFAVGVAVGFARRSDGSTALAAVVGYLVFDYVTKQMFAGSRIADQVNNVFIPDPAHPGKFAATINLGEQNPTRVLGGILIGLLAALLYQRFYRIKLPAYLAFFGGRRFVPIITGLASLVVGVIVGLIWSPIGAGLIHLGNWLSGHATAGAGVYGAVNRLLIPLGLHQFVNSIVWFTVPTCNVGGKTAAGDLNCYFLGNQGSGSFMAGFFPVMMFGLPAAAIAIWRAAPPARRKTVGGIMLSAAFISFLTGITEPIEFAFIFVAPVLFAVHIVLTGLSMAVVAATGGRLGFGFSAGAIDMALNAGKSNTHKLPLILLIGVIYAVIYYAVFSYLIRKLNIMTPGREPEPDAEAGEPSAPAVPATGAASPAGAAADDGGGTDHTQALPEPGSA